MTFKDFIKSITITKQDLLAGLTEDEQDVALKNYHPYLINKSVAKHPVNILVVNLINQFPHLDKKLHYHFLLYSGLEPNIPSTKKGKYNTGWKITTEQFNLVKEYLGYNNLKTKSALQILTKAQVYNIVYLLSKQKGGC